MYELKITVSKVLGTCTADPPMKRGDYITVRDGDVRIPEGGYICLWALQSVLPLITPKEREILEDTDEDWMWRVHHAQCSDPEGRVILKIERVGKLDVAPIPPQPSPAPELDLHGSGGLLKDLRVVVTEVRGKCTSGMRVGDCFVLRSGRLYIPPHRHFCLYALHAVMPFLPARQRAHQSGDWLMEDCHVICPDPAGNVVMRIEELGLPDTT